MHSRLSVTTQTFLALALLWGSLLLFALRTGSHVVLALHTMVTAAHYQSFSSLLSTSTFAFDVAMIVIAAVVVMVTLWSIIRLARTMIGTMRFAMRVRRETVRTPNRPVLCRPFGAPVTIVNRQRPFAVTMGLLRPRIVLSTGLLTTLDDHELEAVLHHEARHAALRDPLRISILSVLLPLNGLAPTFTRLYETFFADIEIASDRYAIDAMGSRQPLLSALYRLVRTSSMPDLLSVAPFSAMDGRIERLLHGEDARASQTSFFVGLAVSVFVMVLASSGIVLAQCSQPVRCVIRSASAAELPQRPSMSVEIVGNTALCQTPPQPAPFSPLPAHTPFSRPDH